MDPIRTEYDDVVSERTAELFERFEDILYSDGVANDMAMRFQKHRRGVAEETHSPAVAHRTLVCG